MGKLVLGTLLQAIMWLGIISLAFFLILTSAFTFEGTISVERTFHLTLLLGAVFSMGIFRSPVFLEAPHRHGLRPALALLSTSGLTGIAMGLLVALLHAVLVTAMDDTTVVDAFDSVTRAASFTTGATCLVLVARRFELI